MRVKGSGDSRGKEAGPRIGPVSCDLIQTVTKAQSMLRRTPQAVALWLLLSCGDPAADIPAGSPVGRDFGAGREWPFYGGDPGGSHYSTLTEIDRESVQRLRPAWTWTTGEEPWRDPATGTEAVAGRFEATPLVINDTMYLSTPYHRVVALDAATGRELWTYDPESWRHTEQGGRRFIHRGVALWTDGVERRVFINTRDRLVALDAATGRPIPSFGSNGMVKLLAGAPSEADLNHFSHSSPPLVHGDLVIVGSSITDTALYRQPPRGEVQAFDTRTGQRTWTWSALPARGEPGYETWAPGSAEQAGHTNVWAPMSVDSARGLLYLPVSTATNDFYGGARLGMNLFAESLVCLDVRTGTLRWYRQLVHHGLWDYDLASQPVLIRVTHQGRMLDGVAVVGKTGFVYAFERVSGLPLWPIEERPVPTSDVPGESAHPTQPFPTRPAPFSAQGFTTEDVVDFTPEIRERALAWVARFRMGPLFTPPSLEGTIVMPGWMGGAGWGGAAFDPTSGMLYVKASNRPILARLGTPAGTGPRYVADPAVALHAPLDVPVPTGTGRSQPLPINRPPYGTLTAIDMNTGAHRWQVTLGDLPSVRNHPALRGLRLPPLGVPGPPGPIVTAGGLLFLSGGGDVLYAIDVASGEVLWQHPLGDIAHSNPMTYRSDGRQFILIAVGRGAEARLQTFALPRRP